MKKEYLIYKLSEEMKEATRIDIAFVEGILKFGLLVAQRTSPVAEGNAAVHAA